MSWAKIDDHMAFHPKILAAGNEAVGAWVRLLAYACAQLTDGHITTHVASTIASHEVIDTLVSVRLLDVVDGGYQIHDFLDWNPSSETVRAQRAARASAGKIGGLAKAASSKTLASAKQLAKQTSSKTSSKTLANSKQNSAPYPYPYQVNTNPPTPQNFGGGVAGSADTQDPGAHLSVPKLDPDCSAVAGARSDFPVQDGSQAVRDENPPVKDQPGPGPKRGAKGPTGRVKKTPWVLADGTPSALAEYFEAYTDGLSESCGLPCVVSRDGRQQMAMRQLVGIALDPDGVPLTGVPLRRWIYDQAHEYRRSADPRYQAGFEPTSFLRWHSAGRIGSQSNPSSVPMIRMDRALMKI